MQHAGILQTLLSCEVLPSFSRGKDYLVFVCALLSGSVCRQMAGLRVGCWGRRSKRNGKGVPSIMVTGTKAVGTPLYQRKGEL